MANTKIDQATNNSIQNTHRKINTDQHEPIFKVDL